VRWREDIRKLHLLARDPLPVTVHAVEFIVLGDMFGIVTSDEQKNVQVSLPRAPARVPCTLKLRQAAACRL
jgi:hypothetical protein